MSFIIWGCTSQDIIIRYPNSTPKIDTAVVKEAQITYGDSIHVRIAVSDKVAPLSTLLLQVVCNNEIVTSETIRTKGNSSSIQRTYGVPFVANRPDNAAVKIYLTETNVSGITRDSIVSTTIAKRPVITELWLVPDGAGVSTKLSLTDATNLIYSAAGLAYGTSITYKLASKVTLPFHRIDWTGLVFGMTDAVTGNIGLINSTGLSITSSDPTLVGISTFAFDALKFTPKVGGKLLAPVTTLDVNLDLPAILLNSVNFRGGNIYFGEGVEVTFTGITNLANNLSPDYFQVTGPTTAIFLGKTGLYKANYLISAGYLYIEPQTTAVYPDVLWICGVNFGRPQTPYTTTSSWNWNGPLDYAPCRLVSAGVYQVTVYVNDTLVTDKTSTIIGLGSLNFKFFHQTTWSASGLEQQQEEWSTKYTVSSPLQSSSIAGNVGNVIGYGGAAFSGVYRITLNMNDMTIKAVPYP
jgi:hypothetical protein